MLPLCLATCAGRRRDAAPFGDPAVQRDVGQQLGQPALGESELGLLVEQVGQFIEHQQVGERSVSHKTACGTYDSVACVLRPYAAPASRGTVKV
jgi:hypothetical protein